MSFENKINILVVDDHAVVRAGLTALLSQESDFLVVGEAADGQEAVEVWRRHRPNVTLMDLRMPVLDGVEAIRRIRASDPTSAVIVLTTYDGDEDIYQALKAGARGYLPKDTEPAELFVAIRSAGSGKTYLPPTIASKLLERLNAETLTDRELEIVQLLVKGHSNKVVARHLGITEGTVKTHVKSVLGKLDATSRTEAVSIALRRGLARIEHQDDARVATRT